MTARHVLIPLGVLLAGGIGTAILIASRPAPATRDDTPPPPLVRVIEVTTQDVEMSVASQGTISPSSTTQLVAQVSGTVDRLSPRFKTGGSVRAGDTLIELDRRDHELTVTRSAASLAQAKVRLERERAEADVAAREWKELGSGEPSDLLLRGPQLREAAASIAAAEASLAQAELNLSRTRIRSPYAARVGRTDVDRGQFVAPGTPLGRLYSTDRAEVRLPISHADLAYLERPFALVGGGSRNLGSGNGSTGPIVTLEAELGGLAQQWTGRVVRTEAEIDPKSRMLHVIAEIDRPFEHAEDSAPLSLGMFVNAVIHGRLAPNIAIIPRDAVREGSAVWVVDKSQRLEDREVSILRLERDVAFVSAGLATNDLVVVSPLDVAAPGMQVRTITEALMPRKKN